MSCSLILWSEAHSTMRIVSPVCIHLADSIAGQKFLYGISVCLADPGRKARHKVQTSEKPKTSANKAVASHSTTISTTSPSYAKSAVVSTKAATVVRARHYCCLHYCLGYRIGSKQGSCFGPGLVSLHSSKHERARPRRFWWGFGLSCEGLAGNADCTSMYNRYHCLWHCMLSSIKRWHCWQGTLSTAR